jgi:multidrug resistance efflux pump
LSPLGNERLATALTNISRTSPVRQAALGFVTELAQILDCDRVTLGFRTGKSARAFVISHSAGFGARTRLAQAIGSAMDEALDQEIPAAYPAGITAVPAVSRSQEALSREFESAGVLTVPFTALHGRGGAFTFERSRLPVFSPEEVDLCVSAARLAGPMLFVRRASERPLFFRFWSGVWSMLKAVFGPHYLPLKLMLAVAAIAVTATLLIEKDFRVTANAAIEGSVRRTISAPFDGYVSEAFTKSGDLVRQNDLLARLDDRDLQVERQKWQVEALKNRQKFVETLAENQRAEALAARSKLEQAEAQLVLVESSLARTRIVAPFDGTIVAGDLSQSLGAAVSRGQMLFEMAPLGDYRVRLKIDERDIADVAVGQKGELTLASFPTHAYPFEIDRVTLVSTAEDGINYFTVEAKLLEGNVPELRPGMAGLGAVTTVRRSIFWIYTHRLVDTVKLWLWSL